MFIVSLSFPRTMGANTHLQNERNIHLNHIFTKKSTFYDILYSMKIEVDTIHKHNQKTIPFVWSSVFLAPILCV